MPPRPTHYHFQTRLSDAVLTRSLVTADALGPDVPAPSDAPIALAPFHCFECGAPDLGGMFFIPCNSHLDRFASYIYYMRLACGHNTRCIVFEGRATPLALTDGNAEPDWERRVILDEQIILGAIRLLRECSCDQPGPDGGLACYCEIHGG